MNAYVAAVVLPVLYWAGYAVGALRPLHRLERWLGLELVLYEHRSTGRDLLIVAAHVLLHPLLSARSVPHLLFPKTFARPTPGPLAPAPRPAVPEAHVLTPEERAQRDERRRRRETDDGRTD